MLEEPPKQPDDPGDISTPQPGSFLPAENGDHLDIPDTEMTYLDRLAQTEEGRQTLSIIYAQIEEIQLAEARPDAPYETQRDMHHYNNLLQGTQKLFEYAATLPPGEIYDVGTGLGIALRGFRAAYPNLGFVGTNLVGRYGFAERAASLIKYYPEDVPMHQKGKYERLAKEDELFQEDVQAKDIILSTAEDLPGDEDKRGMIFVQSLYGDSQAIAHRAHEVLMPGGFMKVVFEDNLRPGSVGILYRTLRQLGFDVAIEDVYLDTGERGGPHLFHRLLAIKPGGSTPVSAAELLHADRY